MKIAAQRWFLALAAAAVLVVVAKAPSIGGLALQQRAQWTVFILVNVTGIARAPVPSTLPGDSIIARLTLRAKGSQPAVDAEAINGMTTLVAQSQQQVRVQANVTPNPNATLLVTNTQNINLAGTAGTTIRQSCVYTVTSNAASIASWTIKQGLANDFISGSWAGSSLANNSYLQGGTPQPTSSPFVVYPTNWTVMATNGYTKTYCVDLTLSIPGTVKTGSYSTTAVYTLWY